MEYFKIKIKGILIPRSVFIALTGLYMAGLLFSSSRPVLKAPGTEDKVMEQIYNFAHLPAYAILTFLLLCSMDSATPTAQGTAFLISFVFGAANEVVQFYTPGRYFQVSDMMTNGTGALLTLVILKIREVSLKKREA
jgi:VanZ family protein